MLLKDKLDGINRFTYEVVKRLVTSNPQHTFYFLFDRAYDRSFVFSSNVVPIVLFPQARHPFLYIWWFEWSVKNWLNKNKIDVFLSPDGFLSLGAKCKQIPVMHDLNFEHLPDILPWLTSKYYNYFFPKFAKKAARIVTISQFSKQDIASTYNISSDLIDVSCNGISEKFKPASLQNQGAFDQKYTSGHPYFICVGSIHKRKNPEGTIVAFKQVLAQFPDYRLVFAGGNYWGVEFLDALLKDKELKEKVVFTGRIDDDELVAGLSGATAMVYPSVFEGFGIPVLEAFACETPVITSYTTSLPEVAGDAAILVDPLEVDEIASAMLSLIHHPEKRKEMIAKGIGQAKLFSWDKAAGVVQQTIQKVLGV